MPVPIPAGACLRTLGIWVFRIRPLLSALDRQLGASPELGEVFQVQFLWLSVTDGARMINTRRWQSDHAGRSKPASH